MHVYVHTDTDMHVCVHTDTDIHAFTAITVVFGNIEEIIRINRHFYSQVYTQLLTAVTSFVVYSCALTALWQHSETFVRTSLFVTCCSNHFSVPFFRAYASYAENFDQALAAVRCCCTISAFLLHVLYTYTAGSLLHQQVPSLGSLSGGADTQA